MSRTIPIRSSAKTKANHASDPIPVDLLMDPLPQVMLVNITPIIFIKTCTMHVPMKIKTAMVLVLVLPFLFTAAKIKDALPIKANAIEMYAGIPGCTRIVMIALIAYITPMKIQPILRFRIKQNVSTVQPIIFL